MFQVIKQSGAVGWVTLLLTIAGLAAITTIGRRWGRPGSVAAAWAVVVLASGVIGHGVNQLIVDRALQSGTIEAAHRLALLSHGTAESAATGVIAGNCALLLSAVGGVMVLLRRRETPPPAPAKAA
jgi:hypothetical protein